MQQVHTFGVIFVVILGLVSGQSPNATEGIVARDGKALSVFQVVRFPNIACSGSSSLNGTCYTSSECTNKGGTNAGSCASGFGVCCTFTLGCGSTIAENCTYFQSSTTPGSGACGVTICKCSPDICRLRLDFSTFVITGPNTVTTSAFYNLAGSINTATGIKSSFATNCQTDTFTVTGNGGTNPPVICGTNTGYHMLVDASNSCNMLNFQLGVSGIGTTVAATRSWNIKISQISCYDANLAPQSCTQYMTGTTGIINSYNYAQPYQLANQKQNICIRRERGYCKICYTTVINTDFQISSSKNTKGFIGAGCCTYGTKGTLTKGYDCINIPGAKSTKGVVKANNFCGAKLVTAMSTTVATTVCTSLQPFMVTFQTDSFQAAGNAIVAVAGFKLIYWQSTTCT